MVTPNQALLWAALRRADAAELGGRLRPLLATANCTVNRVDGEEYLKQAGRSTVVARAVGRKNVVWGLLTERLDGDSSYEAHSALGFAGGTDESVVARSGLGSGAKGYQVR